MQIYICELCDHYLSFILRETFEKTYGLSWHSKVQLTIYQHWFRIWLGVEQAISCYLANNDPVHWCIYASPGQNELTFSSKNPCIKSHRLQNWQHNIPINTHVSGVLTTPLSIFTECTYHEFCILKTTTKLLSKLQLPMYINMSLS